MAALANVQFIQQTRRTCSLFLFVLFPSLSLTHKKKEREKVIRKYCDGMKSHHLLAAVGFHVPQYLENRAAENPCLCPTTPLWRGAPSPHVTCCSRPPCILTHRLLWSLDWRLRRQSTGSLHHRQKKRGACVVITSTRTFLSFVRYGELMLCRQLRQSTNKRV